MASVLPHNITGQAGINGTVVEKVPDSSVKLVVFSKTEKLRPVSMSVGDVQCRTDEVVGATDVST